jgi:transcriptional regulator with XRE-family HTH domain
MENGQREISIDALNKIAQYFGMTVDQIINFDGNLPKEVVIEDKSLLEQVKLIHELDAEEKNMIFKMIDTFLTKKKFKEFFQKNVASL